MSKPFRERNPVVIGAISISVILLMLLAAFRAQDLPLIGGGDRYTAAFTEAGGLKPEDEVRIAGVRVGKVENVELDGDHVKVTFRVKTDSEFGTETGAAIKVKTILGAMYLALEPAGSGQLKESARDPGRADQLPVRRRRGVLGPRRDGPGHRHRPARGRAHHPGRPDPQHAGGVPRRPGRRLRPLRQHRGQERPDQLAAHQPRPGDHRPQRSRRRHHQADGGLRRPVPGPGVPPRRRARPAGRDLHAVDRADRAGP